MRCNSIKITILNINIGKHLKIYWRRFYSILSNMKTLLIKTLKQKRDLHCIWKIQCFFRNQLDKKSFLSPISLKGEIQSIHTKNSGLQTVIKADDKFKNSRTSGVFNLFQASTYTPRASLFSDRRTTTEASDNKINGVAQIKLQTKIKQETINQISAVSISRD